MAEYGSLELELKGGKIKIGDLGSAVKTINQHREDIGKSEPFNEGHRPSPVDLILLNHNRPLLEVDSNDLLLRGNFAAQLAGSAERGELNIQTLGERQTKLAEQIKSKAGKMNAEQFNKALRSVYDPLTTTPEAMTEEMKLKAMVMEYEVVCAVNKQAIEVPGLDIKEAFGKVQWNMQHERDRTNGLLADVDKKIAHAKLLEESAKSGDLTPPYPSG